MWSVCQGSGRMWKEKKSKKVRRERGLSGEAVRGGEMNGIGRAWFGLSR